MAVTVPVSRLPMVEVEKLPKSECNDVDVALVVVERTEVKNGIVELALKISPT